MPASLARSLLDVSPVIPVAVISDADLAVPLARALAAGGLPIVELTLRTPAAMEAISRIAAEVPEIILGAGTVIREDHATAAAKAGARFLVSPGSTPSLLAAMNDTGLPCLPGVSTASEVMALLEEEHQEMKFFPAHASGGIEFLRSLAAALPTARFCPTGGVTAKSAHDYLALPNVGSVGGSWITPQHLVTARDWGTITALARAAAQLGHTGTGGERAQ